MDLGLPGKLMMRDFPLRPAVCRESTAVGTNLQHMTTAELQLCMKRCWAQKRCSHAHLRLIARICSP